MCMQDNKDGQQDWADVVRKHTELDLPKRRSPPGPSKAPMMANHPPPSTNDEDDDELWTLVAGSMPTGKKTVVYVGNLKIGRFCCTLELIELRLKMLIRCARFLIRNIHTENTYEPCFIRRPVRTRRPPIPPNLLFRAKKKSSTEWRARSKTEVGGRSSGLFFRHLSPSQLE